MKSLLALLVICAVAVAAMVPRERRALNEEEVPQTALSGSTTTTNKPKTVCAEHTPCGWLIYHPVTHVEQELSSNSYCECDVGKVCSVTRDDLATNSYVLHCRPPKLDNDDNIEDSVINS